MLAAVFLGIGATTSEVLGPAEVIARQLGAEVSMLGLSRDPVVGHDPSSVFIPDQIYRESRPDILVIPGGFGTLELTRDNDIQTWLTAMIDHCAGILTVSTGSLLIASTGKFAQRAVAGHWLSRNRLVEFGSDLSPKEIMVVGNIVTARGSVAARDAAVRLCEMLIYGRR